MIASPPAIEEGLYRLAPTRLTNHRVKRYHGDDLSVAISMLSAEDQDRVRHSYAILLQLLEDLGHAEIATNTARLAEFLRRQLHDELTGVAQVLGRESMAAHPSDKLAEAIHDLRGGGLTPLVGLLQLAALGRAGREMLSSLFYLTRDHLKIMRNVLLGLDNDRRAKDLLPRVHSTDLIVEKWHGTMLHEDGFRARVLVDCAQVVTIGECCLEFGALDRILYNLVNNACRHTADETVRLFLFPVPDAEGENLRFVFLNRLRADDRSRLAAQDLSELFGVRTSTTGSGYGLAIVTEFVHHAYGLPTGADAVQQGYVGASLLGDCFAAWFHWPKVQNR